jgi:DNA-binding transcriptional LysR family regulator
LGAALLPCEWVEDDIRRGRLIRILPDWYSEEIAIHLVFATKRGMVPAVRVMIDHLAAYFKSRHGQGLVGKKAERTRSTNPRSS